MTFEEMVEMVLILKAEDYDGRHGPYKYPNKVKAAIMEKVRRSLHRKFGVKRSKEQIRKRSCDLKKREPEQMKRIRRVIRRSKFVIYFVRFVPRHVFFISGCTVIFF